MTSPVDTKKGRYYPWKHDKYVSVTTAISEGLPKPALNRWFVKSMAEKAIREVDVISSLPTDEALEYLLKPESDLNHAAILGSHVHSIIEKLSRGEEIQTPTSKQQPYVESFLKFIQDYNPVFLETESTVFSRQHGYAGTMDAMAQIGDKRYVIDYKTGKAVWPEAALQISAYRYADFLGRPDGREDGLPPCDGGLVLHIRPRGYEIIPVDTSTAVFDTFLSALDLFRWISMDSGNVIGEKW